MNEHTTIEGYKIYVFTNAIPDDICESWILRFRKDTDNFVGYNRELSTEIFTLLKNHIDFPFPVLDHQGSTTFVRLKKPIYPHLDIVYGKETHKVAFYLNEVEGGGTEFQNGSDWILIEAHKGTVVIFDIRIRHRGQQTQEEKVKYVMGIRVCV
jgi:hypothetical protein